MEINEAGVVKVGVHAVTIDRSTFELADTLSPVFDTLADDLSGSYGGTIEHLWIDLELTGLTAKPDGTPRPPFRFQKRVTGRVPFGLPQVPDRFNVGHSSVRPDFAMIRSLSADQTIACALSLIYRNTEVPQGKTKKLGGFDSEQFRTRFREVCQGMGYPCLA